MLLLGPAIAASIAPSTTGENVRLSAARVAKDA